MIEEDAQTRYAELARMLVAAVLAAALAGCAIGLPHSEVARGDAPRDARHAAVERAPGAGPAPGGEARNELADGGARAEIPPPAGAGARATEATRADGRPAPQLDGDLTAGAERIRAQVARRMSRHAPAVHGRVARTVVAEAKRASVDPLLVLAVIHVESSFDPHAVSSAGAIGLMQLLEPTMRSEMERSGLHLADPRDPVANVQAGVRYLRRLLDAFDGELDTALMAYNAGPNRIRGHLRQGRIPERFRVYPRKVRGELERLRARRAETESATKAARSSG